MSNFDKYVLPSQKEREYSLPLFAFGNENGDMQDIIFTPRRRSDFVHSRSPEKYLMKQLRKNTVTIHEAARDGLLDTIRSRVSECPSDVGVRDENGLCPLHYAARHNNLETLNLLLELGANIDCQGKKGFTPLHVALR